MSDHDAGDFGAPAADSEHLHTAGFAVSSGGVVDATGLGGDPRADTAADGDELEGTTGGLT
jgi:hypothetical protein